jgi:hypothetical protein
MATIAGKGRVLSKQTAVAGAFQLSAPLRKFHDEVVKEKKKVISSTSYCSRFKIGFNEDELRLLKVEEAVVPAMESLPSFTGVDATIDKDSFSNRTSQWFSFFAVYGTHFLSNVHLGGKVMVDVCTFIRKICHPCFFCMIYQ